MKSPVIGERPLVKQIRFYEPTQILDIFTFPDGKFMVTIINTDEKAQNKIIYDLFNFDGYFLQSFYWKGIQEYITYVDRQGYAYSLSGRSYVPKVSKYKIEFIDN